MTADVTLAPMLETTGLGKRYGDRWALRDCTLRVPAGRVVGLVGANGSGKTTLLHLAVGLLAPTTGSIRIAGDLPARDAHALANVGFVAQDSPLYPSLTVAEHLELGRRLNSQWDEGFARTRVESVPLDPAQKAAHLSGGQRTQLALTLALAKQPGVLLLDEPAASLDPLARRELLGALMEAVADRSLTVVLSSHLVADLERVCDFVIVLAHGRVQVAGDVDELLAQHKLLTGARRDVHATASASYVVHASHTDRQTTALVRVREPILDPSWSVSAVGLEDLVLAYMADDRAGAPEPGAGIGFDRPRHLEVQR